MMPKGKAKWTIDGDTIELMNGMRVRIAGYDAPELDEHGGKAAKQRLSKLVRGKTIGLSNELGRSYGRTVRRVTVKGKSVEKLMQKRK
jgi:micrococcal nuclease